MFKVVIPPAELALRLPDAKKHLRVDGDHDDDLITSYIKAATAIVENRTNRALITRTVREQFTSCQAHVPLQLSPVQEIVAVTYQDGAGVAQTMPGADYELDEYATPQRVRPAGYSSWPFTWCGTGAYQLAHIEYIAGYGDSADDIPADLQHAIKLVLAHLYENREAVLITGGIQAVEIPMAAKMLMDSYKVYL